MVTGNDHVQWIVEQNSLLEARIVLTITVGLHGDDNCKVDSFRNQQVEAACRFSLKNLHLQQGAC